MIAPAPLSTLCSMFSDLVIPVYSYTCAYTGCTSSAHVSYNGRYIQPRAVLGSRFCLVHRYCAETSCIVR